MLLYSFPIYGQVPSNASTSITPSATSSHLYTATDTVQAIHRLFKARRTGGYILTGGAVIFTRIVFTSAGTVPAGVFGVVVGGIPAVIGFGKIVRFSMSSENKVVEDFEKTKTLPKSIRRRLKREYFKYAGVLLKKAPPA
ncbi:hypothetical protein [Hymenobacter agri]